MKDASGNEILEPSFLLNAPFVGVIAHQTKASDTVLCLNLMYGLRSWSHNHSIRAVGYSKSEYYHPECYILGMSSCTGNVENL